MLFPWCLCHAGVSQAVPVLPVPPHTWGVAPGFGKQLGEGSRAVPVARLGDTAGQDDLTHGFI